MKHIAITSKFNDPFKTANQNCFVLFFRKKIQKFKTFDGILIKMNCFFLPINIKNFFVYGINLNRQLELSNGSKDKLNLLREVVMFQLDFRYQSCTFSQNQKCI